MKSVKDLLGMTLNSALYKAIKLINIFFLEFAVLLMYNFKKSVTEDK